MRVSGLSQDPVHTGPMPAADKHGKPLNLAHVISTHPPPQTGPQGLPGATDSGPSVLGATAAQPGLLLQPWAGSPQACRALGRDESQ